MTKLIFTFILFVVLLPLFGQTKPLQGAYGYTDLRIRAGSGLIEEGRLKKFDFNLTGYRKVAILYWPDETIGLQKIGITVFENVEQVKAADSSFFTRNIDYLERRFNDIQDIAFTVIDQPDNIEALFNRKPILSQVKILDTGSEFFNSLKAQEFDALFIMYEDQFSDLITGSKVWLPSKGLFKYFKKELVYYGLYSTLIDLQSLQTVKHIGYKQFSADYSPVPFKEIAALTAEERAVLLMALSTRFENNIEEMISIHKLK